MPRKILVILIWVNFISLNVNDIFAHQENKQEDWEPISASPVTTWTAPLCGKGKFVIQPFFFYNRTRGLFNSEGHYDSLTDGDKKYQFQQQLFMQYGLTDRLEIDAQIVYQQNYRKQGEQKAHSRGFGDSYLFLRYCIIEENDKSPPYYRIISIKNSYRKIPKATFNSEVQHLNKKIHEVFCN